MHHSATLQEMEREIHFEITFDVSKILHVFRMKWRYTTFHVLSLQNTTDYLTFLHLLQETQILDLHLELSLQFLLSGYLST